MKLDEINEVADKVVLLTLLADCFDEPGLAEQVEQIVSSLGAENE